MAAKKKNRPRKPSQVDKLHLGPEIARLKASMPPKRWKRFVKWAHARGYTVAGAASSAPNALKERTNQSLQKEAARTIATAFKPATRELDRRSVAQRNLEAKRREDDARFQQWLSGEQNLMNAQASAADTTLRTEQDKIRTETEQAIAAAKADSMQRMGAVAGAVSDPNQSAALDTTAKDAQTRETIANQRANSEMIMKIGADARTLGRAAVAAQAVARRAEIEGLGTKERAAINADRLDLRDKRGAAAVELLQALKERNMGNAQSQREFALAMHELGVKKFDIATSAAAAEKKFRLEQSKFKLDVWVAKNKALAEKAKLQLGYDKIAATQGEKAADRALRQWVERYKAKTKKDKKAGVDKDEREIYGHLQTAVRLIAKMHRDWDQKKSGALHPDKHRDHLRSKYGINDALIDAASALYRSGGAINAEARKALKRVGIKHIGYFFGSSTGSGAANHPRT